MSATNFFLVTARHTPNSAGLVGASVEAHYKSPLIASGAIRAAGGTLPEGAVTNDADAKARIEGSWAIVGAESAERVWEQIKEDVWWHNGVWDTEKVTVVPIFVGKGNFE